MPMKLTAKERAVLRKMQSAGGKARAKKLDAEQRSAISRMGARASHLAQGFKVSPAPPGEAV